MVEIGHQVDLKCMAPIGMPPPSVYWLRGSQPLQSSTDVLVTSEGHLLIGQAKPQDTGNYTCVAENIAAKRLAPPSQIIVYGEFLATIYIENIWKENCGMIQQYFHYIRSARTAAYTIEYKKSY